MNYYIKWTSTRNTFFSSCISFNLPAGRQGSANHGSGHVTGDSSAIVGGNQNTLSSNYGFIGGGYINEVHGQRSSVAGGTNNIICAGAYNSFIGGGHYNKVSGSCSSVVGGHYNTVSGIYSSILGGYNNTVSAGYNNAHIIGSGITVGPAVGNGIPNALNVNGLWANGIPFNPGPQPAGTIFAMPNATPPIWAVPGRTGILFIS